MKMKFCAVFLLAVLAHGADLRVVRAARSTVTLRQGDTPRKLVLPEAVATDLEDAVLLAWRQARGTHFLLLLVSEPSRRSPNGMGPCGAGWESTVVWVKLENWTIRELRHQRVESCREPFNLMGGPRWKDGVCSIVYWEYTDGGREVTLRYDAKKPAEGFSFTAKPLE